MAWRANGRHGVPMDAMPFRPRSQPLCPLCSRTLGQRTQVPDSHDIWKIISLLAICEIMCRGQPRLVSSVTRLGGLPPDRGARGSGGPWPKEAKGLVARAWDLFDCRQKPKGHQPVLGRANSETFQRRDCYDRFWDRGAERRACELRPLLHLHLQAREPVGPGSCMTGFGFGEFPKAQNEVLWAI